MHTFTSGPWLVGSEDSIECGRYINIKGADGYHIAKVSSRDDDQLDANASLIAASLCLYRAGLMMLTADTKEHKKIARKAMELALSKAEEGIKS